MAQDHDLQVLVDLAPPPEHEPAARDCLSPRSTGSGAFEVLVDRYTGWVHPEPGPNMVWNTQYGFMGSGGVAGSPSLTAREALGRAQAYLDRWLPGATAEGVIEFPGYYTIDVARDGRTFGMLSVNAYTGRVWAHTWHGRFIAETEAEDLEVGPVGGRQGWQRSHRIPT